MDELTILREQWEDPEPPSHHARTSAKVALMRHATDPGAGTVLRAISRPRPQRTRRLVLAGAATAIAGVLALAIGSFMFPTGSAEAPPVADPGSASGAAGEEILLAAATTALRQPDATGEYWYIKEEIEDPLVEVDGGENPQTLESWIRVDGDSWRRNLCCAEVYRDTGPAGFVLGGSLLTLAQLQELPADAEQLTAWIADSQANPSGWPMDDQSAPVEEQREAREPEEQSLADEQLAIRLSELLYQVPAPAQVRAAAFEALAGLSEVTSLGAMAGGEGLRIAVTPPAADKYPDNEVPAGADSITLVIDPETATLSQMITYPVTVTILAAEWTDQAPPGVQ